MGKHGERVGFNSCSCLKVLASCPIAFPPMNDTIYVAVYGSLKEGFYNHRLLRGQRLVGKGHVTGFEMFSMGSFPMIIEGKGNVAVEVYEVDSATMDNLDRLEGFPRFYDRQRVSAVVQSNEPRPWTRAVACWIYYGQPYQVEGCNRVTGGVWKQPD